jgi:3D (Asp-Asp-Asp) domain-containing protein
VVAVGSAVAPEAVSGELYIGNGVIITADGDVLTYVDEISSLATAYTCEGWGRPGITATGTIARVGEIAVDPKYIPYGTRMYIVSNDGVYEYGLSVAEDCGGAIKGDRVDLYFPTYEACMNFGRRDCTIFFLG